jgi:hypothetical protein
MKHRKQNGFVLLLVIVAIGLIGAEMFVLTGISNQILFQSDTAYLQACERNLATSGLAWTKRNIKNADKETFDRPIELDVSSTNIYGATLSVDIITAEDEEAEVQINTSCIHDRHTLRHSSRYLIRLKD